MGHLSDYMPVFPYYAIVDSHVPLNPVTGNPIVVPTAFLLQDVDSHPTLALLKELEHVNDHLSFFNKKTSDFIAIQIQSFQIAHILSVLSREQGTNIDLLFEPNHVRQFPGWRVPYSIAVQIR
jgi:hypothetical protein